MTKEEKSILIAVSIGDGCLRRNSGCKDSVYLGLQHSAKQKDYLEWKVNLIESICGGKKCRIVEFNNSGYLGVRWSKTNKYFRVIRKWLYPDNKKTISRKILDKLTPKGIAIWYMDDGNLSLKKRDGEIHARELFLNTHVTKEENQEIIDYFWERWGIKFGQVKNRGNYRLRCGTKEAKKFIQLVEPYIISSMSYKIDMKYQ